MCRCAPAAEEDAGDHEGFGGHSGNAVLPSCISRTGTYLTGSLFLLLFSNLFCLESFDLFIRVHLGIDLIQSFRFGMIREVINFAGFLWIRRELALFLLAGLLKLVLFSNNKQKHPIRFVQQATVEL